MTHTLRKVLRWTHTTNPNETQRDLHPIVWAAELSCGHRIHFGITPQPKRTHLPCVECGSHVDGMAA